jgi:hypothetical protein
MLLSPGSYVVQRRAANSYREYKVTLEKGSRVKLEDAGYEELAYSRLLRKVGGSVSAVHRLTLSGAARGAVIEGHAIAPNVIVGYGVDLEWFSIGLGARWSMSRAFAQNSDLDGRDHEFALRLTAERYIDVSFISFSLGLLVEGIYHRQIFSEDAEAPDRSSFAFGFGGLFAIEADITPAMLIRLEGGPVSQVYKRGVIRGGELIGNEIATPLTWWAGLGMGWRI